MILLDTNICIAIIKQQPKDILRKFNDYQVGQVCISSVTLAELRYGVAKSQYHQKNQAALDEFILPLEVADFDEAAADYYGRLRAGLERQSTPIGALDTMIAGHALSLNVALVTNNTREFSRVAGLQLLDWVAG